MPQFAQTLVIISTIVQSLFMIPYIKDTLKGTTKPNRMSFIMWSIAPLIAAFAALADGIGWSVVPIFVTGLLPLTVLAVSFVNKNSYWKLAKADYICGAFSLLALILWILTQEPVIAIIFAIISDSLATLPSLIKAWKHPETETVEAYIGALIGAIVSFIIIDNWTFSAWAFPVYFIIADVLFVVFIQRKKFLK